MLIIYEFEQDAILIEKELEKSHYRILYKKVSNLEEIRKLLAEKTWDVILSDFKFYGFNAFVILNIFKEIDIEIPLFIVISEAIGEEISTELIRDGAHDFIRKRNLSRLVPVIERELKKIDIKLENKISREALRESEELNKAILDSITAHMAVLDKNGNIIAINNAWKKFAVENSCSFEKVGIGVNYFDICRKAIGEQAVFAHDAMLGIQKVINGQLEAFIMEYPCHSPTEQSWFELSVVPLNSKNNGVVIKHQNITEGKKLEEKLLQSQKLEAVGRLAAGIAHDFNNLLTVILGSANLANIKINNNKSAIGELEQIQEASQRAANLTQQLLVFARKQVTSPRFIDLNSLIVNLNKMLYRIIGENIELIAALTPAQCVIKADPGQIEQVIINLVINARDSMPVNGKLFIETSIIAKEVNNELILLTIRDTGTGMSDEVKSHIFEPFFTTKKVGKGTGLGLATCYGIITQCGGNIEVDSEVNLGTTVKVYLPKAVGVTHVSNIKYDQVSIPDGNETILLVEDEPLVLRVTSSILQSKGYKVIEASNGAEALKIAREGNNGSEIKLLISDIVMPHMTGREVAEKLREEFPKIRILFMSGYTEDNMVHNMTEKNIDFIHKPFLPDVFLQNVRNVLDR